MKPDYDELTTFVAKWKQRNEERCGLHLEIKFEVNAYEQLDLEVDRV